MKEKPFVVLGAGGHARVVLEALHSAGLAVAAVTDANQALWGTQLEGIRILGGDDRLADFSPERYAAAVGIGAARNTRLRRKVHMALKEAGYTLPPLVASSALVARSARLDAGAQVLTRAVVHPASVVGEGTVVNTAAIIEHDCTVGAHSFIGPAAVLCGGVKVGTGTFIGAGAIVLPGVTVGSGALIAAGAVIRKDVADDAKALGSDLRRGAKR